MTLSHAYNSSFMALVKKIEYDQNVAIKYFDFNYMKVGELINKINAISLALEKKRIFQDKNWCIN